MNIIADLHNHTIVSKHAFNTITEIARRASELSHFAIAITDHGPDLSDGAHPWYFWTLKNQPDIMEGIFVIKGIEANIVDIDGRLDCEAIIEAGCVDFTLVSIHGDFFERLERDAATELWLNIAKRTKVDMIGHSEESRYAYDYDRVTKAFSDNNKIVELNVASANVRPGNEENMKELILACKNNETHVAINSDSHSIYTLGKYNSMVTLLRELDFPKELVVNSSKERLLSMFRTHNPELYRRLSEYDIAFI